MPSPGGRAPLLVAAPAQSPPAGSLLSRARSLPALVEGRSQAANPASPVASCTVGSARQFMAPRDRTPRRSTAAPSPGPPRLPSGRVRGRLSLTLSAPTPSRFSQWEHPQASHMSPQLKVLALCLSSVKSFLN